jgi:hypothetical protein
MLQVNKNFAFDLIAEDPVVVCDEKTVWSNSGGALGHPKVYINLVSYWEIKVIQTFINLVSFWEIKVIQTFTSFW